MADNWAAVITVIITNLAGILMALAVLVSVIKGSFKSLNEKVDGHLSRMITALQDAKKVEGKVDAMIQAPPPQTTVIQDRRKE